MEIDLANLTGVGVAGLSVYLFWKLAANHITHNTEAIEKLSKAIDLLTQWLKNNK